MSRTLLRRRPGGGGPGGGPGRRPGGGGPPARRRRPAGPTFPPARLPTGPPWVIGLASAWLRALDRAAHVCAVANKPRARSTACSAGVGRRRAGSSVLLGSRAPELQRAPPADLARPDSGVLHNPTPQGSGKTTRVRVAPACVSLPDHHRDETSDHLRPTPRAPLRNTLRSRPSMASSL